MTLAADPRSASGTAWTVVLALTTIVGSLAAACMMPFVALATIAAATLPRGRAAATIGAAWACNQAIGFALLGYPPTAYTIGWGVALGAGALLAMFVAARVLGSRRSVALLAPAFLAAFAAYELGLFGFASIVGGSGTFTAPIVLKILLNDAAWLALLVAAHAVLARSAPHAFGPGLRLGIA